MANETSFDLNVAIQRWRENLAQSPAFRSENLNELESHLRDSVAALQAKGLSAEEVFIIAARRLGTCKALEAEFGKVNRKILWADRVLWMLVGLQFWRFVFDIVNAVVPALARAASDITFRTRFGVSATSVRLGLIFVLNDVVPPLILGLATLIMWKVVSEAKTKGSVLMDRWLSKPLALALGLFLLSVGNRTLSNFFEYFFLYPSRPEHWMSLAGSLSLQLLSVPVLVAALTFVFARKRLRAATV
jgi:hypothetical protein